MRAALAITLIAVSAAVLLTNTYGGALAQNSARVLFIALCVIGLGTSTIREKALSCAALALCAVLYISGKVDGVLAGLDLAAYFAAFIALLTALKIAAQRSNSVRVVGKYLIDQPAARRFVATATGGHILGVFLNFGAVSLMAPLIQSATKHADGSTNTALEQRQISALLRGFAWILLWAPTTLSQAVLLTLFTDINMGKLIPIGIGTALFMMFIGFAYDRFEWRHLSPTQSGVERPIFQPLAFLKLGTVCFSLIAATAVLQISAGYTTALSLMFVAPVVTLIWFGAQKDLDGSLGSQLASFWPALLGDTAGLARSAIALGLSGFIGRTLAEALPVASLVQNIDLGSVPGWLFLACLPILITLGGQIALSPIILVVFIGQVVQSFPTLPADPTHIVFALSAGWAISMFASPNATATLLISATSKIPPTTLTWRWNLRYGVICYIALVGIFILLEA